MTSNVWWRFGTDRRRRGDAIEATISPCEPDLVGHPVEHAEQAGVEVGVGLLSRWPVVESRVHRLPAVHHPPPVALEARIDHIVVGPGHGGTRIRARTARVLDEPVGDVWASDHFALVVDADVEPAAVSA
jgi:endonuclease/exonuclease/phosphatase family metal-dependent hydrolase